MLFVGLEAACPCGDVELGPKVEPNKVELFCCVVDASVFAGGGPAGVVDSEGNWNSGLFDAGVVSPAEANGLDAPVLGNPPPEKRDF